MEPYGMFALLLLLPLLFVVLAVYRWVRSRGPNPFAVDTRRPPAPLITDKAVRRTVLKAGTPIPVPPSPYRHPRTPIPVPPSPYRRSPLPPRNAPGPPSSRCPGTPVLPRGSPGAPPLFFPRMPQNPHPHISPRGAPKKFPSIPPVVPHPCVPPANPGTPTPGAPHPHAIPSPTTFWVPPHTEDPPIFSPPSRSFLPRKSPGEARRHRHRQRHRGAGGGRAAGQGGPAGAGAGAARQAGGLLPRVQREGLRVRHRYVWAWGAQRAATHSF